ncbi:MAG: hypothetical protein U9N81_10905 [Bacillota bacterium]|nr:hypothetical protein [Bacillota bacterium]
MKIGKVILYIVGFLLVLAASFYALHYFYIIDISERLSVIPVLGEKIGDSTQNPLQKLQEENDILKQDLEENRNRLSAVEAELEKSNQLQLQYEESESNYKEEIIQLNQQLADVLSQEPSKDYKKIAGYYAEMKTQDAADLIAALSDENAVDILQSMQTDVSAPILSKMPREKAVKITQMMLVNSSN